MQEVLDRPLGLRERKKAQRRLALIDAAHRLVEERGYEHVTVEDIAEAAGVSTRTFFNYFDTKDDAVVPFFLPTENSAMVEFAAGGPTGDLAADLEHMVRQALEAWKENAERIARGARLAERHPQLLARRVVGIERYRLEVTALFAARAGRERPAPEDVIGALAFTNLLRGAIAFWEAEPEGPEPAERLPEVRALLRGLTGSPAP